MESGSVTTPFGRRSMTLAMLSRQVASQQIVANKSVDKWKLFRNLCIAKPRLGVTDRALAVLNALLSFYPKNELAEEHGLVVFPSNVQLSIRAHGMAEQTIRRHLAALIAAGLLIRKDSPNGKRYARKRRSGEIGEAYGFSLAPLLARSEELEQLAADVDEERLCLQRLRERLTLCRRDITKFVTAALDEGCDGHWLNFRFQLEAALERLPRVPDVKQLSEAVAELERLRREVINQLERQENFGKQSGNPNQTERHIQNTESESINEEAVVVCANEERASQAMPNRGLRRSSAFLSERQSESTFPPLSLPLVLQACPRITDYGPHGRVSNWQELLSASHVVQSMLGISASAYRDACSVLGLQQASILIACLLERAEELSSPGGYLRELTRRAAQQKLAIVPMLLTLLKTKSYEVHRTHQISVNKPMPTLC
jgi:Replication protein C C-terminal region./Replication protein C N-terminal domain.